MKTLVVYYSYSGITKELAKLIAELTHGEERELIPLKPYSLTYHTAVKEVRQEMQRGYGPKLASGGEEVSEYDTIFIGSPNWLETFAPPVLTFLQTVDLSGKRLVPFCTHGGGGFGSMEEDIKRECPDSEVLPGLCLSASYDPEDVESWLIGNNWIKS